jgi:23S rRNA (uracil1939-C5)-methyltransferase
MKLDDHVDLVATGFDDEGLVYGEVGGVRVAAPGGVPGDRLRIAVEHESPHGPRAWGRIEAVIAPSPNRALPACPNVGRCGGCLLQCAAYPVQLATKQDRMQRTVGALCDELRPIVASPNVLHYRNKAKLVVAPGIVLGSYAPRTHQVIDMAGCQVTEQPIDPVARTLARLLGETDLRPYDERGATGDLRYAVIRANHAAKVLVVIVTAAREAPGLREAAIALRKAHPEIAGVVQNVNPARGAVILGGEDVILDGAGELDERIGEVVLRLGAQAFFQVNRAQAAALYARVAEAAELSQMDVAADVFCGVGGIAFTLARAGGRVVGIEGNVVAASDARRSAPPNVEITSEDAFDGLHRLKSANVIVVDPPRKGCEPRVLAEMARLRPRRILYVSCGPDSLARDLAALAQLGYRARWVEPYDLFPHTPHVESLSVLEPA